VAGEREKEKIKKKKRKKRIKDGKTLLALKSSGLIGCQVGCHQLGEPQGDPCLDGGVF